MHSLRGVGYVVLPHLVALEVDELAERAERVRGEGGCPANEVKVTELMNNGACSSGACD